MKQYIGVFLVAGAVALVGCSAVPLTSPSQTTVYESPAVADSIQNQQIKTAKVMTTQVSPPGLHHLPTTNTEKYLDFQDNPTRSAIKDPISTFSVDVDTAAYSNIRRMMDREGRIPPQDAVRIEEMVNYFNYQYPIPDSLDTPFSLTTEIAPAPWNPNRHLLQIGLKGYEPDPVDRPNSNLVFLIDVSGSMNSPDKLPLLKRSLRLLVNQMSKDDRIALAVYAGAAGLVLDSTSGSEKAKIINAIDSLGARGGTNGGAGLHLAYQVASQNKIEGGINRIIIASDGDMNVGVADHDSLIELIEKKRKSGIALTTLGFGAGNYNYALMEQLADTGNGNAAYIDTIREAKKVLVDEMNSTLLTIAKDVKIQIEFNPQQVAEYRLIGYENRLLADEDFRNDKVDAGDIGAGHTVTALYEVTLAGSEHTSLPTSRYTQSSIPSQHNEELAFIKLRFKKPDEDTSREITQPIQINEIKQSISDTSTDFRFASAVAGFGQMLRGGKYTGTWGVKNIVDLALGAKGGDRYGYRGEFISLVELADSIGLP